GMQLRPILIRDVGGLVQHGQAHDMELHLDIAHFFDLQDPARGDPAERTRGIEPEVNSLAGGGCLGTPLSGGRHGRSHKISCGSNARMTVQYPLHRSAIHVQRNSPSTYSWHR